MTEKYIQFWFLKKLIRDNSHLFPKKLSCIKIFHNESEILIDFIDKDNINVTDAFMNRKIGDNNNLYSIIVDEISSNPKIIKLEKGFIYTHKADYKSSLKPFVNGRAVIDMIGTKTRNSIVNDTGISSITIYNMVSDFKIDYSLSTVLKMCDYFKVSPFKLLNKEYGKELLDVTMNEFVFKANLTDEETKVIYKIKDVYYPKQKS
jgi:hypothetical protein